METLPLAAQIVLIAGPIVLFVGWLIAVKIGTNEADSIDVDVTEAEWQHAWRVELASSIRNVYWQLLPAVVHLGFIYSSFENRLLTISLAGIYIGLILYQLGRVAKHVEMDWSEAKTTRWAKSVLANASKKNIPRRAPEERFGQNGEVLR